MLLAHSSFRDETKNKRCSFKIKREVGVCVGVCEYLFYQAKVGVREIGKE
jgi:hypothetical protein